MGLRPAFIILLLSVLRSADSFVTPFLRSITGTSLSLQFRSNIGLRHARTRTLTMLAPTTAEITTVVNAAVKAICASREAPQFNKVKVMGVMSSGKPKEGSVNVRFLIKGEDPKPSPDGKPQRPGGQGQVSAQTEGGKLVRVFIDKDMGWGSRIFVLGSPP